MQHGRRGPDVRRYAVFEEHQDLVEKGESDRYRLLRRLLVIVVQDGIRLVLLGNGAQLLGQRDDLQFEKGKFAAVPRMQQGVLRRPAQRDDVPGERALAGDRAQDGEQVRDGQRDQEQPGDSRGRGRDDD